MYGKLVIECELVVRTGMHIGGSSAFSAIGAVDSPVITDALTNQPIVPGSSLKGKLRTLLARSIAWNQGKNIEAMPVHNKDEEIICKLFGSSDPVRTARLQFADAFVINAEKMKNIGFTEIKSENVIDRETCKAMPRQIERVVPGVCFGVRIVYDVRGDAEEIKEDMKLLAKGMKLLQMDYLGGHGTRGSGRVSLKNFTFKPFECEAPVDVLTEIFKEVENYELLPV